MATRIVLCIHGVGCHFDNYHQCWAAAILPRLEQRLPSEEVSEFSFTSLKWNYLYDDCDIQSDCKKAFPNGWINTNARDGARDARRYFYLHSPLRQHAIRETCKIIRCLAAVADELHIIAHSLGSVIAFQALHRLDGSIPVASFQTIGSPLASTLPVLGLEVSVPYLMRLFRVPYDLSRQLLKRPKNVARWLNLMDTDDFVYLSGERKVSAFCDMREPGDLDWTGAIHNAECADLTLGRIPRGLRDTVNHESVCEHLYYFHPDGPAAEKMAAFLLSSPEPGASLPAT